MITKGQKRVPSNLCKDFIKLIANLINFLFVSILKSSGPGPYIRRV